MKRIMSGVAAVFLLSGCASTEAVREATEAANRAAIAAQNSAGASTLAAEATRQASIAADKASASSDRNTVALDALRASLSSSYSTHRAPVTLEVQFYLTPANDAGAKTICQRLSYRDGFYIRPLNYGAHVITCTP